MLQKFPFLSVDSRESLSGSTDPILPEFYLHSQYGMKISHRSQTYLRGAYFCSRKSEAD